MDIRHADYIFLILSYVNAHQTMSRHYSKMRLQSDHSTSTSLTTISKTLHSVIAGAGIQTTRYAGSFPVELAKSALWSGSVTDIDFTEW